MRHLYFSVPIFLFLYGSSPEFERVHATGIKHGSCPDTPTELVVDDVMISSRTSARFRMMEGRKVELIEIPAVIHEDLKVQMLLGYQQYKTQEELQAYCKDPTHLAETVTYAKALINPLSEERLRLLFLKKLGVQYRVRNTFELVGLADHKNDSSRRLNIKASVAHNIIGPLSLKHGLDLSCIERLVPGLVQNSGFAPLEPRKSLTPLVCDLVNKNMKLWLDIASYDGKTMRIEIDGAVASPL